MKLGVIGDWETVHGFGLTGIEHRFLADAKENATDAFEQATDPRLKLGILIMTETVGDWLTEVIDRWRRQNRLFPIIVQIPDKTGPIKRPDPISSLIRRAVGVDITKTSK